MQETEGNHCRRSLLFVGYAIGFSTVFYFYVLLRIRPELFYQQKPDVFLFDSYFFAGFWDEPGGPTDYLSAFLSPLLFRGWLGAGMLTLLTVLICLATRWYIAAVTGSGGQVVFLLPAVLIATVLGQYCHPVWLCVSLLAALVFANAYVRIGTGYATVRFAVFVIVSALVYYVAAGLYVLFALLCAVFEWRVKRRRRLGAACALCASAVPAAAGLWLLDLSTFEAYTFEAYRGTVVPPALYWLAVPASMPLAMVFWGGLLLFFPLAAVVLARRPAVKTPAGVDPGGGNDGEFSADDARVSDRRISATRLAVQLVLLVALGVGADVAAFDSATRCLLQITYAADRERWADVLAHVQRFPPGNAHRSGLRTVFQINRALYFSGDLLDRMFCYVQNLNAPTLALRYRNALTIASMVPLEGSDVLFQLGRINESEHLAYEALVVFGERPRTLKRLIYIHALKGQPDAARRFLNLMQRSLLHRRWACRISRQLDADPTLSNLPVIASRRELMITSDAEGELDREAMFSQLLERNRRNRMAFEYLIAYYLMTRQLDKVVENLYRLDDFDYPHLPRHCEEALVMYLETTGSPAPDLGQRKIQPETRQRYREFMATLRQYRGNAPAAFAALYHDYGDTYFFAHTFGHNDPLYRHSGWPR